KNPKKRQQDTHEVLAEFRNIKPFKEDVLEVDRRRKAEEAKRYKTTLDKAGRRDSRADHERQQYFKANPDLVVKEAPKKATPQPAKVAKAADTKAAPSPAKPAAAAAPARPQRPAALPPPHPPMPQQPMPQHQQPMQQPMHPGYANPYGHPGYGQPYPYPL